MRRAGRQLSGKQQQRCVRSSRSSRRKEVQAPQPTALRQWDRLGRTAADMSAASEDVPLIVCPKCVEPRCSKAGNIAMVSCNLCDGDLHRSCAVRGGDDGAGNEVVEFEGIRCSPCATTKKGKKKSRAA